jgi:hypothetical protein
MRELGEQGIRAACGEPANARTRQAKNCRPLFYLLGYCDYQFD